MYCTEAVCKSVSETRVGSCNKEKANVHWPTVTASSVLFFNYYTLLYGTCWVVMVCGRALYIVLQRMMAMLLVTVGSASKTHPFTTLHLIPCFMFTFDKGSLPNHAHLFADLVLHHTTCCFMEPYAGGAAGLTICLLAKFHSWRQERSGYKQMNNKVFHQPFLFLTYCRAGNFHSQQIFAVFVVVLRPPN